MQQQRVRRLYRFISILVLMVLLASGLPARASALGAAGTIMYVKASAPAGGNGTSWSSAFKNLQSALLVAVPGQQIWVAGGSYRPTSGLSRGVSFELKEGVAMYGGFAGNETQLSQRKPAVRITILSGDIGDTGDSTDNSYHVVRIGIVTEATIVDGFTIAGGNASASGPDGSGGGILNYGDATLRNLIIISNSANIGGGLYNDSGKPTITNVSFINNHAGLNGGGLFTTGASSYISSTLFSKNSAQTGGGLYTNGGASNLWNVTFNENSAGSHGGGIYNQGLGIAQLDNATFRGNKAGTNGDAMMNYNSDPPIRNSIFWDNGITDEMLNVAGAAPTLANSIVQGDCPANAICSNIITDDPKLGPLHNNGGYTQTLALLAGSPAIDTGDTPTCTATDQRGVTRPQGAACDIGAYEVRVATFVSAALYDGHVRESGNATDQGGLVNTTATYFVVGDDALDRRLRGFLSFNTSSLPDNATILSAGILVKQKSHVDDPFLTQVGLVADLAKPYFGAQPGLAISDWQATPTVTSAVDFGNTSVADGDWYSASLGSLARSNVNKLGLTQFRLGFTGETYNATAENVALFSGNAAAADRPMLWMYYNP